MGKLKRLGNYLLTGTLWGLVFENVFKYSLPQMTGFLSLIFYRIIFRNVRTGRNIKCWGRMLISKSPLSSIAIGSDCVLVSSRSRATIAIFSPVKISAYKGSRISIGNKVSMNGTCITCRSTSVEIGDNTMIASNVIIVDSDFHAPWPPEDRTHNMGYERDSGVKIGENVWLGMNTIVLKGVSIGDNSIITAGSVVVEDIPANVVAGGVPARVIKILP